MLLTVVIEPKQNGQEDGKGNGQEDIPDRNVPKVHKPTPIRRGHEGDTSRQHLQIDGLHPANVHKPRKEDEGERGAVVLEEDADVVVEQAAPADTGAEVGDHEDEQGGDDREVKGLGVAQPLEDLDALLEVDEGHVEAEDVAGEARDVAEPVARVRDGEDPVEN